MGAGEGEMASVVLSLFSLKGTDSKKPQPSLSTFGFWNTSPHLSLLVIGGGRETVDIANAESRVA